MSRYRVCFDGEWQGDFDEPEDALAWGHEVAKTGRIVHVAKARWVLPMKLLAVFPEDREHEATHLWRWRAPPNNLLG